MGVKQYRIRHKNCRHHESESGQFSGLCYPANNPPDPGFGYKDRSTRVNSAFSYWGYLIAWLSSKPSLRMFSTIRWQMARPNARLLFLIAVVSSISRLLLWHSPNYVSPMRHCGLRGRVPVEVPEIVWASPSWRRRNLTKASAFQAEKIEQPGFASIQLVFMRRLDQLP